MLHYPRGGNSPAEPTSFQVVFDLNYEGAENAIEALTVDAGARLRLPRSPSHRLCVYRLVC